MPRGKANKNQIEAQARKGMYAARFEGEVGWGGYINIRIDAETKAKYAAWIVSDGSGFWSLLEDTLSEGMKYGLSYDAENNCYIATFTGCGVSNSADRFCLTARSDRFEDATGLLVYKHSVICGGDWGNYRPRTGFVDNWG